MATIKDIADEAGVSPGTVSRVLNFDNSLSIAQSKRQLVFEIAERLEYATPRQRAKKKTRKVKQQKLALIHFISPSQELEDPYYIAIRMGIESRCEDLGYQLVKIYSENQDIRNSQLKTMDAAVAVGNFSYEDSEWMKSQCPNLVFVDSSPKEELFDSVVLDLERVIHNIMDEVMARGYRKIAFFGGTEIYPNYNTPLGEVRQKAFIEHALAHDLDIEGQMYVASFSAADGYIMAQKLLAKTERPELIVCASDALAIGAMKALREADVQVPDDIAVVGIDDIPTAQYLNPTLTTVRLHAELLGETAVDLVGEQLAGRTVAKKVTISSKLIWRESFPELIR